MKYEDILQRVIEVFKTMTDVEDITAESEIIDDLEINSMDILMMISSLEAEFKIKVPEKEMRKMAVVGDMADIIARQLN